MLQPAFALDGCFRGMLVRIVFSRVRGAVCLRLRARLVGAAARDFFPFPGMDELEQARSYAKNESKLSESERGDRSVCG